MKKNFIKFIKSDKAMYIFLFFVSLIIFYLMPFQGDDWYWGSKIGLENLKRGFENYNGRYLGNFLILLMSRFRILRSIIVTSSLFSIIFLLKKNFNLKKSVEVYFTIILLLVMDSTILSQSVAWASGFVNYVPPAIIFLSIIYINKDGFENKKYSISNNKNILMLILGILGSLFAEHMTTFNLLLAIFLVTYNKIKQKKYILANIYFLIGSIAGTLLMFSNGAYYQILQNNDGYRDIVSSSNFISRIFYGYFGKIYKPYILNSVILNVVLGIILLVIGYKFLEKNKIKDKMKKIVKLLMLVVVVFNTYNLSRVVLFENRLTVIKNIRIFEGLLSGVYLLSIIGLIFICIKDIVIKKKVLFLLFSTMVMVAPLFFVSPVGPRCFFPVYVSLIGVVTLLFKHIIDEGHVNVNHLNFLKGVVLVIFMSLVMVYSIIIKVDIERRKQIDKYKNEERLILPKLPFSKYHWNGNPYDEGFVETFKAFYEIEKEVKVEFIEYYKWKKIRR